MKNIDEYLVSVIVPVYNTERFLSECIERILNQTHKNLEVILINDGSTDDSALICKKYLYDIRVKFIDRMNLGLSQTRKEGIDLVKGEYFCNLDSDDYWDVDFIDKMLTLAVKSNADIVTCGRKDFGSNYKRDFYLTSTKQIYELEKIDISENLYALHQELWLPDSWNKMYKTKFVKKTKVEYVLPNRFNGTDYLYNHLMILHCPKYAVLNEPLIHHRIVQGSRVHRKNKPLQEGFEYIVRTVYREAQKLEYPELFYENYNYCYVSMLRMVFYAIITESSSCIEAYRRFNDFYSRRRKFESELEIDLKQFYHKSYDKNKSILYRVMMGNSCAFAQMIYFISKAKTKLSQLLNIFKGRMNHEQ